MAVLGWTMVGLALWHFTVFLPDRFWGGIVGAFLGALVGSVLFGFAVNGFGVPARADTDVLTVLQCVPGTALGLAAIYAFGISREGTEPATGPPDGPPAA
jgi:hypothetical protein